MKKTIVFLIFYFFYHINCDSQTRKGYEENSAYSYNVLDKMSKGNNVYNFMALGYFINANNIMYSKTKDTVYLSQNLNLIENILHSYLTNQKRSIKWTIQVSKNNGNYSHNGSESIVFEGYFFRYLGQFLKIITDDNLFKDKQRFILKGLTYAFNKWNNLSEEKYGDQSLLFHYRLHIAATWAEVALYLDCLGVSKKTYQQFYTTFDDRLKHSLELKTDDAKNYFIWNSTYDTNFTKMLKDKNKNKKSIIQDVTHANHIVEYIISAVKLGNSSWKKNDLKKLSNTILYSMYSPNHQIFSDNVDGSSSKNESFKNTGWKISDGWMKLIPYNNKLRKLFVKFYASNLVKIKNSSLFLQFQANLYEQ